MTTILLYSPKRYGTDDLSKRHHFSVLCSLEAIKTAKLALRLPDKVNFNTTRCILSYLRSSDVTWRQQHRYASKSSSTSSIPKRCLISACQLHILCDAQADCVEEAQKIGICELEICIMDTNRTSEPSRCLSRSLSCFRHQWVRFTHQYPVGHNPRLYFQISCLRSPQLYLCTLGTSACPARRSVGGAIFQPSLLTQPTLDAAGHTGYVARLCHSTFRASKEHPC